ncbi:MAG: hypothetical protein BGP24_10160 [Lysobacterales bacterium 69-70]|nr:MAG: hypothetical protein ABS97_13180 [Xanthomonadaceae bacterium SCN 69-320]ODV16573.1 MAG: hypothetical protein ABT27_19600 [Xanthomonadaceae bacterium SCN 69-25]OJZ00848.1 MAG: hypothetical protein BGP24_10160 [Xanthomonadales bacterium 69-70]
MTGCASLGNPRSNERLGWVKAIIEGAAITDRATHPCVAPLGAGEITAHRWVVVGIPHGRYRRMHTVMLPDAITVAKGDRVLINTADCAVPLRRSE